jgi:two-component system phosphate regulon sensor histidine kinase PhoR
VRSDFVANVSHELRTPLTVLKGFVETLEDAGDAVPERYRKVFRHMEEQTERMQKLIDGLLSLTRLESATQSPHKPVHVGELLRSIVEDAALAARAQPELSLELESQAELLGAETELRSAFSNLIYNALKYTPANGQVIVRWLEQDGCGLVEVEDNGPGIAAEHLPRLTERFYRVETGKKGNGKDGVGLGLAIVKHVMTRHDGELKIASAPGQGSRFSCRFPGKRLLRTKAAG